MSYRAAAAVRYIDGRVWILDQTQLPDREIWVDGSTPALMVAHLQALRVRGAPLIGVSAALSLAAYAAAGATGWECLAGMDLLVSARPTAVALAVAVGRLRPYAEDPMLLIKEALALFDEDVDQCQAIALAGARWLEDGDGVLTHCNTGALATAGVGTALGALQHAWGRLGRMIHVYVCETRPCLQGARLTAFELMKAGVPHTLITDSMAALLMRQGQIQKVLVGADRIAANGDTANKVGTYSLAVLAAHHGIPLGIAAPWGTVDLGCPDGDHIPIEERDAEEVRGLPSHRVRWAPTGTPVTNPAFDVTPVGYVARYILDRGVVAGATVGLYGMEAALGVADPHLGF